MGIEPMNDEGAPEHRYETGKGCMILSLVVVGFLIASTLIAILTGM